ncbi:MAG: hypothetical protein WCD86_25705 [Ktedonobacteraceae bacterium]
MGYETTHSISIVKGDASKINDVIDRAGQVSRYGRDVENTSIKWYECEKDMIEVSKEFPDLTIMVHGVGEVYDDTWKLYVKNGKSVTCSGRIVFDEFKEEDLI